MTTATLQSFRTSNVPGYISNCLSSVRSWADGQGYGYEFLDDRFLQLVPEWYRQKAGRFTCVVADLARLLWARTKLDEGVERVIWVDADVLIFCPERFTLQDSAGFQYCKEVWLQRTAAGGVAPIYKVNNSVCSFGLEARDHLDEYIDRCLRTVRDAPVLTSQLSVGTDVLTGLYARSAQITNVGMVSPVLLLAIIMGDERVVADYAAWHGSPIFAANLCNTFRQGLAGVNGMFDYLVDTAVSKLRKDLGGRLAGVASAHPYISPFTPRRGVRIIRDGQRQAPAPWGRLDGGVWRLVAAPTGEEL